MTERNPHVAESPERAGAPPAGSDYLLPLHEAAGAPLRLVGGKAANLARLAAAGFPVPEGAVLTTRGTRLAREAPGDGDEAEPSLPEDVREALAEAVAALGEGPLAIRSSGIDEDAADASYAGQYASYLDVRGRDEVERAVRRCLASARSPRLRAYRAAVGQEEAPLAVLIQRMVPARAAGVAFTADPVTGERDQVVVHAVRGLGERLVAGRVTPDAWRVGDDDEARQEGHGERVLHASEVVEVARLARRLEAEAGDPQDVEWAFDERGLHLLQARPITMLPMAPEIEPPAGPWMKDAVHYTGPMSPLGASTFLPRLERGLARLCSYGLLMEGIRQRTIGWEVYGQPLPPSSDAVVQERIAAAVDLVRHDRPSAWVRQWWDRWRLEFTERLGALRERELAAMDDDALDAHLGACLDLLEHGQEVHFQLFVPYLLAAYDLSKTCRDLLDWELPDTLELVSGLSETTTAPARELAGLAREVRARPEAASLVRDWEAGADAGAFLDRLRAVAPDVARSVRDHLQRYGCRIPAYDVGEPTYAERPELTLTLLRDLVEGTTDPRREAEELERRREAAADRARDELARRGATSEDHDRFEETLQRARERWGLREDNLLYTDSMPNGLIRWAALELGRRLCVRGRLARPEDAVWLELDELRSAVSAADGGPVDLRERVRRRRREHAWVRAHPGPPWRGEPPSPPPSLEGMPGEVRYLNHAMAWMMGIEYGPAGGGEEGEVLRGLPGSPGRATATARIVNGPDQFHRVGSGDVVICRLTTPEWTALFARAGAVVTDAGSPLSHAAIVAREHGIPAVVGTQHATRVLADGLRVAVDGAAGTVTRVGSG